MVESKISEIGKLAGMVLGNAVYSRVTGGRSAYRDIATLRRAIDDPTEFATDAALSLGNRTWNAATGRNLYADIETVSGSVNSLKRAAEDPTEFTYDLAKRKLTGQLVSDDSLMSLVKYVLSDKADREFTVADQETLHKLADGKLQGRYIDGLYVPNTGRSYVDREIAKDPAKKRVTYLHEKLEALSNRKGESEDEEDHVNLHVSVLQGLRKAYISFNGEIKGRAKEAINAFYDMMNEASDDDGLFTKVRQRVPRKEVLFAIEGMQ